jgi:hypothetical protein
MTVDIVNEREQLVARLVHIVRGVNKQDLRERFEPAPHLPCLQRDRLRRFVVIHKYRCSIASAFANLSQNSFKALFGGLFSSTFLPQPGHHVVHIS